jgi:transposase-like protein
MSRNKFDEEFKTNAVNYRLKNVHKSLEEIAKDIGVGISTLSKWISIYQKNNLNEIKPKLSQEQQELKRLKKENEDLKEINEILKKAHKYFVSQSI